MTENEAINDLNAASAESDALASTVTAAFADFNAADVELTKAVDGVTEALASLESNINYGGVKPG